MIQEQVRPSAAGINAACVSITTTACSHCSAFAARQSPRIRASGRRPRLQCTAAACRAAPRLQTPPRSRASAHRPEPAAERQASFLVSGYSAEAGNAMGCPQAPLDSSMRQPMAGLTRRKRSQGNAVRMSSLTAAFTGILPGCHCCFPIRVLCSSGDSPVESWTPAKPLSGGFCCHGQRPEAQCSAAMFLRGTAAKLLVRGVTSSRSLTRTMASLQKTSYGQHERIPGYIGGPADRPAVIVLQARAGISMLLLSEKCMLSAPDIYKLVVLGYSHMHSH